MGGKGAPFYRVVVSDSRRVPTGPVAETLGHYDPKQNPPVIKLDVDRADELIRKGAHASATVRSLMERARSASL
jgi:small subunit ribosomal protein S16